MSSEILFLAHRIPYPPDRGDKIRSWHMLKAIAQFAPVHVVALWDDQRDLAHVAFLRETAASVTVKRSNRSKVGAALQALVSGQSASVTAFKNEALQSSVSEILSSRPIKTIFAYSGQMAQYVPASLDRKRFVMDFVDMDSAKFAAYADRSQGPMAWANARESARLRAFETAVARRADLSLFVSAAEASYFVEQTGVASERVSFIENGIDLNMYNPAAAFPPVLPDGGPLIVFTGQMDYRPNSDAVEQFARITLPMIQAHVPGARFAIVGRAPAPAVRALGLLPGIIVTGEVDDTRNWIAAADVVVAPLLMARGIQNKVLEAMAMAKPVVASPAAALGIDAKNGCEIIIASGPAEQAAAVVDLITTPARLGAIGKAARLRVEARYSWEATLCGLPAALGFAT